MALLMTVAYDGSAYRGFQLQPGLATVQSVLEETLFGVTGIRARVIGASRTDRGVHARGQVAVWRTEACPIPTARLAVVLNRRLPPAIRVREARDVPASFDPRRCTAKTYSYHLVTGPVTDPFRVSRVAVSGAPLALAPLNRWAGLYLGRHDFAAFRHQGSSARTTVRRILAAHWEVAADEWVFWVTGDGFLYHMVRLMVGAMLLAAQEGADAPIRDALDHPELPPRFTAAPASGLCLEKVWF